jgi:osmoprotectant transport system substrate-binding protein
LETYTDLAAVAGELTLGAPPECQELPLCIPGFQEVYGIEFGNFVPLDAGPTIFDALANGDIDVARVFSTDPPIGEQGLIVLEDDEGLNPAQNVIPVFTENLDNAAFLDVLNAVSAALTTDDLIALNAQVIIDLEDPEDVATQWLEDNDLS